MAGLVGVLIMMVLPIVIVVAVLLYFARATGLSRPIRNGVPSEATIQAYRDTGMYERGTGNFGSIYDLKLLVPPIGGAGQPYVVQIRSTIDSITDPNVGDRLPVIISPTNPMRVKVDHSRTRPRDDKEWHTA
jgi:hypothetical protein